MVIDEKFLQRCAAADSQLTPDQALSHALNRIEWYARDNALAGADVAAIFEAGMAARTTA